MSLEPNTFLTNRADILVAEDDENDAFLIRRAFKKAAPRLQVEFVKDGREAISYIEHLHELTAPGPQNPMLLLLDLKMPHLDGFQVLEWLRISAHPPVTVVVFTSSTDPADLKRAQELGAADYLVKPHDGSDYVRIVQELERRATRLAAA